MNPKTTFTCLAAALLLAASAGAAARVEYNLDTTVFNGGEVAFQDREAAGKQPGVYAGALSAESRAYVEASLQSGAKLLLLIRHGKAAHNDDREQEAMWRVASSFGAGNMVDERSLPAQLRLKLVDPPLVDEGHQQATELGLALLPWFRWLQTFDNSAVSYVSSPLFRAVETATTVAPEVDWTLDENVREAVSTLGSDLRNPLSELQHIIQGNNWRVSSNVYDDEDGAYPISRDVAEITKMPVSGYPTMFSDEDLYMGELRFEDIKPRVEKWLGRVLFADNEVIHVVSSHGIFLSTVLDLVGFGKYRLANCEMVPLLLWPDIVQDEEVGH